MWAPSDRVLAQVAFPRIRSFDSSACATPPRTGPGIRPDPPPVDLSAIVAPLAGAEDATSSGGSKQAWELEWQFRRREQDLAAALAQITALEAALQATLQQIEARDASRSRPDDT